MSIADARYEPSELEGLMSHALSESDKQVRKLRKALVEINMLPKTKMSHFDYVTAVQNICVEALDSK